MPQAVNRKTYTFFMPEEERIFFRHFHVIAVAILLVVAFLSIFVSETNAEDALVFALVLVLSMYLVRAIYGKRFAESVALDFDSRTVRFLFPDERGSLEKGFQDVRKIRFRFYLTFVMDDGLIMVKRPRNKKEIFQLLQSVSQVDVGMFKGF